MVLHLIPIQHYVLRLKEIEDCCVYEESEGGSAEGSKFLIQNSHQVFFCQFEARLLFRLTHCCLVDGLPLVAFPTRKADLP